jgi:hypothetical protein
MFIPHPELTVCLASVELTPSKATGDSKMDVTSLIIQLISGAIGGNAAGAASKDISLGPLGNTIVGALGGGVGGQILNTVLGLGGAAAVSGLDINTIVSGFLTGGVSGGLTALVIGFLKSRLAA